MKCKIQEITEERSNMNFFERLEKILNHTKTFPDFKFIIAHLGGNFIYTATLLASKKGNEISNSDDKSSGRVPK